MSEWKEKSLDELGKVSRGKSRHRPRNAEFLYGGPYPFVQTSDIKNANFIIREYSQTYSENGLKQSKLWPINTLCITIAANIADTAILGFEGCFPDSILGFNSYENISDVRFVKYCFDILQQKIKQISQGAAQDNLSVEKLLTVKFLVPEFKTQQRIASILSAYDDLIENNLKRIKLLEEIAQRTYEEWFVKFRINGVQLEVGVNGLPEGWERKRLVEVAEINNGYAFKANHFSNDKKGTPIIRIRNIPSSTTNDFTSEIVDDKYYVNKGDLLVGMDGEFYINNWSGPKAYLVQRSCNIKSIDKKYHGYLSQAIVKPIKYFEATISGATVAHLGKKHLDTIEIIIPNKKHEKLLDSFNDWLNNKIILSHQNSLLKESRDILLPRLMSGKVGV